MKKQQLFIISIKLFSIILLLFFTENQHFISRIKDLSSSYGLSGTMIFISIWLSSLLGLLAASLSSFYLIRLFFSLFLFITTLIGASFAMISKGALIYDNLYILFQNIDYTLNALTQYPLEIFKAFLLACFSFSFLIRPPQLYIKVLSLLKPLVYLLPFIPLATLFSINLLRDGYGTQGAPLPYRIPALAAFIGVENIFSSSIKRETVKYPVHRKASPPHIVLIIDESIRGDYYDINNDTLNLTPYLDSQKNRLYNFGLASSGANCSAESNQILRYAVNPNNLEQSFKKNPYIWEFAQKAGYKTVMIEGQAKKGGLNDRMTKNELLYIDEFIYPEGENGYEKDQTVARIIRRLTASHPSKPLFIYAIKSGLHFPYSYRIPPNQQKFHTNSNGYDIGTKSDLINSYKNGIAYITDPFFKTLLHQNTYPGSILIYTSDHGQNLLDNGNRQTHCSTSNTSAFEGLVPLFAITDEPQYKNQFQLAALKNKDKASHFNIMPTVLNLLGYEAKDIRQNFGNTLFDDITQPQKFITGLLKEKNIGIGRRNEIKWMHLPDSLKKNIQQAQRPASKRQTTYLPGN